MLGAICINDHKIVCTHLTTNSDTVFIQLIHPFPFVHHMEVVYRIDNDSKIDLTGPVDYPIRPTTMGLHEEMQDCVAFLHWPYKVLSSDRSMYFEASQCCIMDGHMVSS